MSGSQSRIGQIGFTLVELLVVIVIIAILAAVTYVSYSGFQDRAREATRVSDMRQIVTALELYRIDEDSFPPVATSGLGSQEGWENSAREAEGQFIRPLVTSGTIRGAVPVDPENTAIENTVMQTIGNDTEAYYYYVYGAGSNSCDPARGDYYLLAFGRKNYTDPPHPDSPGFDCPGRTWSGEFRWVTGGFVR